jgi:head-tail adaptor
MVKKCQPKPLGWTTTSRPRRITIQYDATPQSTTDGSVALFSTPATLFMATTISWKTMGGRMEYMADQARGENVSIIRIRWRADKIVTPAHRVLYVDGQGTHHILDIVNVTDDGNQHQFWNLTVSEKSI